MAVAHHTAETEKARISRQTRHLPAKRKADALRRLKCSIRSLETIVRRGLVNEHVAVKLETIASELKTARLLIET
ncbi:MAG: hypothetical protein IID41_15940 [Planctomycetes bacterium]|nr:hypothetical protein [Planctomycetota bacterium]